MKTHLVILLLAMASFGQAQDFVLKVQNFESTDGKIRAGMFDREDVWLEESVYNSDTIIYSKSEVTLIFKSVPDGEYAISIYQDINENGELDTNLIGIPTEPYAFSNNALGQFGPAKYVDARFRVDRTNRIHTIKLN